MSYDVLGNQLKDNMMAGKPTRTKAFRDYSGYPIPPCGNFATPIHRSTTSSPWLDHLDSQENISLDQEITKYLEYVQPTSQEIARRENLVQRFTQLIETFKLNVTVEPFGSYVTGLYLSTSDIDMVVISRSPAFSSHQLRQILHKIRRSRFASEVVDILHAKVPLLKITDKVTGIQIDLTANQSDYDNHAIESTRAVQRWMQEETELKRTLILIMKMFLSIRKCGTTYTGGMNSYVLVWMVVAWVTLEWPKLKDEPNEADDASSSIAVPVAPPPDRKIQGTGLRNLNDGRLPYGKALIGFLEFYGHKFDYRTKRIKIEPTPSYSKKPVSYFQPYLLSIIDPAASHIDLGAKAYGIKHIQASFIAAHSALSHAAPQNGTRTQPSSVNSQVLLAKILDGDFTDFVRIKAKLQESNQLHQQ